MPKRQRVRSIQITCPLSSPPAFLPSLPLPHPHHTLNSHAQTLVMSTPGPRPPPNRRVRALGLLSAAVLLMAPTNPTLALSEPQKLVAEAWRVVDHSYVDRTFNHHDWFQVRMRAVKHAYASIDESYSAIRDMLALLQDPYTRFLSPQQFASLSSSATGELAGVGVEMFPARVADRLKVTSPLDDSPAARAGVRPSDVITLIDGEATDLLTPDEAAARIRGRPGTSVSLTVVHDGGQGEEESFQLIRESLKLKSVKAQMIRPHELLVKVKQFNSSTADDLRDALEQLKDQGVERIVLDLRNNPGGYFPAGVDVARLFVKSGTPIVYVVDKNGVQDEIDAVVDGMFTEEPMVVLVNNATASASEILAGALKDNRRAKLVGERTFGKGVVQTVAQLSDGSGLAVTIARYETPGHNNINKVGIAPDVNKTCKADADVQTCLSADVW